MRVIRVLVLCLSVVTPLLVACGGGSGSGGTTPLNPSVLNGNWLITGSDNGSSAPYLAVSLGFVGNQGYAYGTEGVTCSNGTTVGGYLVPFTGTVASNGSFELSTPAGELPGIVLTGQVPESASSGWKGTYAFTGGSVGSVSCPLSASGSSAATPYPAINGTYTGKVTSHSGAASMQVSLTLSQGTFGPTPQIAIFPYYLDYSTPANVAATISGSPCFTSGTTNAMTPGVMNGSEFVAHMAMSDGSVYTFIGAFPDASENSLTLQISDTTVLDKCDFSGNGTLTRQ